MHSCPYPSPSRHLQLGDRGHRQPLRQCEWKISILESSLTVFRRSLPLDINSDISSFGSRFAFPWLNSRPYSNRGSKACARRGDKLWTCRRRSARRYGMHIWRVYKVDGLRMKRLDQRIVMSKRCLIPMPEKSAQGQNPWVRPSINDGDTKGWWLRSNVRKAGTSIGVTIEEMRSRQADSGEGWGHCYISL